ncbi:class II SORL domain-containing protein [Marinobacter hydrocarbonoclasticus]|nr:class II SORL domain-containing protein [Marinobacter nauticus]
MQRRELIRLGLVGAAATLVAPRQVLAGVQGSPMAGGVYYTKDAPGRWSKKVAGHLPVIEVDKDAGKIKVITGHEMKGYEHYIVKHTLLDADFNYIDERMFDPMKDAAPISEYALAGYSGPLYALSMCNKHDVWLNMIEV